MDNQYNDHKNHNSDDGINARDFLIGALVGGIVGAAAALFLAPKSGKEIRTDLSLQAQTLKEKTGHLRETALMRGTEIVETAKEKTNTLGQTVSKQSTEIINKVKELTHMGEGEDLEANNLDSSVTSDDEIQRKLEETKKAFDETESLLNT